jgi:hypothetical protein
MGVYANATDELVAAVEATGVPVTTATAASGTDSRIGDALGANLRRNGTVVLVSDGRVTEGEPLAAVAETARSLNATVSTVGLDPVRDEYAVDVSGSSTASVGLQTAFTVTVSGVGDLTNTTVDVGTLNTSSPTYTYDIPDDRNYNTYNVTVDGNTSYVGSVDIGTTQYATGGGGGMLSGDVIGSNPLGSNVLRAILAIVAVVGTGAAITVLSGDD